MNIDPKKTYVIVNVDEPDDRTFWCNGEGWVDYECADIFFGHEIIEKDYRLPMGGGWIDVSTFT